MTSTTTNSANGTKQWTQAHNKSNVNPEIHHQPWTPTDVKSRELPLRKYHTKYRARHRRIQSKNVEN